eukprot:6466929-Amphidinium_carterae.2
MARRQHLLRPAELDSHRKWVLQQPWKLVHVQVADLTLPSLTEVRAILSARVWRTLEAVACHAARASPLRVQRVLINIKRISRT